MKNFARLILVFLNVFPPNQVFAASYYYQTASDRSHTGLILGDSSFAYSLSQDQGSSEEVFEKGLTRIAVLRNHGNATMWIEQRTTLGFITLKYKSSGQNWDNTEITFRRYSTFYKGSMGDECAPVPSTKNQDSISDTKDEMDKQNFTQVVFDNSCKDKLSPEEFKNLVDTAYYLLHGDLGESKVPPILSCVNSQGNVSKIRQPFKELRARADDLVKKSNSVETVKKNISSQFPISCTFNGEAKKLCGEASEGIKTKINFDARCLKGQGANKENAISLFMHEFVHTVRLPRSEKDTYLVPFTEKQVKQFEAGNCDPKDIILAEKPSLDLSKNKVVADENAKSTGAKKLAGDVANPYSSFADRAVTPGSTQTTALATNESSTGAAETGGGSASSAAQQRSIASINSFNSGSNSASSSKYNAPSLQQQAQYQNVKTYVDASVSTVAKKIAPIVSYVESPAFAQTLPPTSFENGNRGETIATTSTGEVTASTAVSKAASSTTRSGEVAASSSGGSGGVVSGNSANLGSSASSGSTRSPAAINKNANRLSSTDSSLDNAYALKVRKKLLSDNAYRTELRNKGVQIEFADGYKFETPSSKVLYTEKNGVLVRGK